MPLLVDAFRYDSIKTSTALPALSLDTIPLSTAAETPMEVDPTEDAPEEAMFLMMPLRLKGRDDGVEESKGVVVRYGTAVGDEVAMEEATERGLFVGDGVDFCVSAGGSLGSKMKDLEGV